MNTNLLTIVKQTIAANDAYHVLKTTSYLYDAGLLVMRKGKNAAKIKIIGKDNEIALLGVGHNRRIRGIRRPAR